MPIKENPKRLLELAMDPQHINQQVCHKSSSSSITIINLYPFFLSEKSLNSSKNYALLYFISPNSKDPPTPRIQFQIQKTLLLHPTNSSKPICSQVNTHINIDTWVYKNRSGNSNILHLSQNSKTRNTQITKSNKNHKSIINQT